MINLFDDIDTMINNAAPQVLNLLGVGPTPQGLSKPDLLTEAWQNYAQQRGVPDLLGGAAQQSAWDLANGRDPFRIPTNSDGFFLSAPKQPAPGPTPTPAPSSTVPKASSPNASGGSYGSHEQYRASIEKWAQVNGIDPDALAAILQIETDGDPTRVSPAGARGLGQIMPSTWLGLADPGDDPFDPDASIKNAAKYYAQQYRATGDYGLAAAAYQGGLGAIVGGQPRDDITDGNLSPKGYANLWQQKYQTIKAQPRPQAGPSMAPGGGLATIWGGQGNPTITQEFGDTDFSAGNPIYDYGSQFGTHGHTGLDIGLADGSRLFSPVNGTVIIAGGSGYYKDETGNRNPATSGEVRIKMDDGSEVILGHTSLVGVHVGQRVRAGDFVALSGTANGPHLHLEWRIPDASLPSGYRIVDPRQYLGH